MNNIPLGPAEHRRLFGLLHKANALERRIRKSMDQGKKHFLLRNFILIFQVMPFGFAIVIAIVVAIARKHATAPAWLAWFGLVALLFSYLAAFAHPILYAWVNRRAVINATKNPFSLLLNNARVTTVVDSWLLPQLLCSPIDHLKLLHLELKAEKEFFERRLSLVVGAIDKVGLGPGLLAVSHDMTTPLTNQNSWITVLAYAMPVIYLFGMAAHFLLMRLDRVVSLTELAITRKEQANKMLSPRAKLATLRHSA